MKSEEDIFYKDIFNKCIYTDCFDYCDYTMSMTNEDIQPYDEEHEVWLNTWASDSSSYSSRKKSS